MDGSSKYLAKQRKYFSQFSVHNTSKNDHIVKMILLINFIYYKVTKGVSNSGALFNTSAAENDTIVASKASCAHPTVKLGLYCLV